jgi:hemolysin activation/secretion protein
MNRLLILAAMLVAVATPSFAQFIDRTRVDRQPAGAPAPAEAPKQAPEGEFSITPFVLKQVQVTGASIAPEAIAVASKPFIGHMLDSSGLKQITNAISDAYSKSDIALYTIIAPKQDFANGVLKLVVVEGYIEHVDIQADNAESMDLSLLSAYASKLAAEKPLRKATLQRYISLIRDIPGVKPDIQLVAGSAPGATRLVIKIGQNRWRWGAGLINNGNPLLGRTQVEMDLISYGLLREGEQTNLTYSTATNTNQLQFVSLADAEPIDTEGTTERLTGGWIHTQTLTGLKGEAETLQLLVSHPLIRSYDENLYLSADVDGLDSSNAVLGSTPANERVRAIRASATYSLSSPIDLLSLSATLSQGIDGLGARVIDPGISVPAFEKLNLNLGYNRLLDPEWVIRLKTTGQLPGERLPISELFSLGGPDYGRAFAYSTAIGDTAAAGSIELAWHPAQFPISWLNGSEAYIFTDRGETWFLSRGTLNGGTVTLASAGLGVRLAFFKDTSLQLEEARQLAVPDGFNHAWVFNIGLKTLQ